MTASGSSFLSKSVLVDDLPEVCTLMPCSAILSFTSWGELPACRGRDQNSFEDHDCQGPRLEEKFQVRKIHIDINPRGSSLPAQGSIDELVGQLFRHVSKAPSKSKSL